LGYNTNKKIGEVNISNTGDIEYSNNNCSLTFRLSHALSDSNKLCFDGDSLCLTPSEPITVLTETNRTVEINGSFGSPSAPTEEKINITLTEVTGRATSNSTSNLTSTMVTSSGGPYLKQAITSSPTILNLTFANFSLNSYILNLAGNDSVINTAYNVSYNWSLPTGFLVREGNVSLNFTNISDSARIYSNLNISFNSSNLAGLSPGTSTIYLYASGVNNTGDGIVHSGGNSLLTETATIVLQCHSASDGIYVTACGSLDGDYVTPTTGETGSSGGGGGGAGISAGVLSKVDYYLVRGKENNIYVTIENRNANYTLSDVRLSVTGGISKYIEVSPTTFDSILPKGKRDVTLMITSPGFISLGRQEITLHIRGTLDRKSYKEDKLIVLQIAEVSEEDAGIYFEEMKSLIDKMKASNLSSDYLENMLSDSEKRFNNFEYTGLLENYEIIKSQVEDGLKAQEVIGELDSLSIVAGEKGIDISGTDRIMKLAKLSLKRGDFEQAFLRAKEAQVTYALEVKGEIGKMSYYLKNNPREISLAAMFLALFAFTSFKLTKLQILKSKIKSLREEENILAELMKVVQIETFKENKMSMEEYYEAMEQYESRLANVIESLIELETRRAHELKFTSKNKMLSSERDRVIDLVKKLQKDYLQDGILEKKSYDLKLRSYNKRLSDIDQTLATLEAKAALKGRRK